MQIIDRPKLIEDTAARIALDHDLPIELIKAELDKYPNSFSLMLSLKSETRVVKAVKAKLKD